jgi:hypothetical protein
MATIHWLHGVNGDFAIAANWTSATVPGVSDTAAIDAAGTYTVTTSASETVASLDTVVGAKLAIANSVFIDLDGTGLGVNAGTVAVGNSAQLDFDGVFANTGKITLNATSSIAEVLIRTGDGTLTGGGKVTLTDNGGNEIVGEIGTETLTNVDNTIAGAGQLGAGQMALVNQAKGVVDANGKTHALILDAGANTVSNAGILEATGSGGLVVSGTVVDNAPTGVIQAVGANVHVFLDGAR